MEQGEAEGAGDEEDGKIGDEDADIINEDEEEEEEGLDLEKRLKLFDA
jgi:hypothetical protein